MGKHRKAAIFVLTGAMLLLVSYFLGREDMLSLDYVRKNHVILEQTIAAHYARSAGVFILLYMSTALMVPGAIILTVAAGAFFGTIPAVILVNVASAAGSAVAFMLTRHLLGTWLQRRYHVQLEGLNRELERHGRNYLMTLRIIPILPAFVINYLVGLTRISFWTFIWTTSVGVLPGSLVYAYAGSRLNSIRDPSEIMTWPFMLSLLILGIFSLLPVLLRHLPKLWRWFECRFGGKK